MKPSIESSPRQVRLDRRQAMQVTGGIGYTDVYPIEQFEEAYNCMIERRARGKVIMTLQG